MSDRDPLDRYYTPPQLVPPLITHLGLDRGPARRILEPCAGDGAIAQPLRALGHEVVTADLDPGVSGLVDHQRCGLSWTRSELVTFDLVITNPPFLTPELHAAELIRHWLASGAALVACLLRLTFLEPCNSGGRGDRVDLLTDGQLSDVLPLPRAAFGGPAREGKRGTGSVICAWFIWRPGHSARGWRPIRTAVCAPPPPTTEPSRQLALI